MRQPLTAAVFFTGLALAGCGGDSGDDDRARTELEAIAAQERAPVARVGRVPITRATYYHWEQIALHQENGCGKACRKQAMRFLITAQWVLQEAQAEGVEVTDRELKREFARERRKSYPNEAAYDGYLRDTRQTEEDLLYRLKVDMLTARLRRAAATIEAGARHPFQAFIKRFYREYRAQTACKQSYYVKQLCGSTLPA